MTDDAPRVSVALCTFNGAPFIAEQLASILSQDPPPFEVVVSDDGSTDNTLAIVRSTARQFTGDRVVVLPAADHLGVTANFERAVAATSGEIIALCDQDDVWHPGRIARIVREFRANPELLLLHHDAELVDVSGARMGLTLFQSLRVRAHERKAIEQGRARDVFIRRNLATGATVAFRSVLLNSARPFPPEWVHDEWLAIVAAAYGQVVIIDDQLIDYRQHSSNQIGAANPRLRYRLGRMVKPRGDRLLRLADRSQVLAARARDQKFPAEFVRLASRKAIFEEHRAKYPRARIGRIAPVFAQLGSYPTLSSQGLKDVLRDILQPG
jgi:glycosyltransferase involved in cell wall biosynthesis